MKVDVMCVLLKPLCLVFTISVFHCSIWKKYTPILLRSVSVCVGIGVCVSKCEIYTVGHNLSRHEKIICHYYLNVSGNFDL